MRLISLAPSNTEILFALGVGAQIVANTSLCDWPIAARKLPHVGGWTTLPDLHFLEDYKPDIVFTSQYLPNGIEQRCADLHIQLVHVCPQRLDQIYDSIRTLGQAVARLAAAKTIITTMQQEFSKLAQAGHDLKQCYRLYAEEWYAPATASANWVPELISLAGGQPLTQPGQWSYPVTDTDIQQFDPAIIIAHWCGFGQRSRPQVIAQRLGWTQLQAVQQNQLYALDDSLLNRPGPRLTAGAQAIQQVLKKYDSSGTV